MTEALKLAELTAIHGAEYSPTITVYVRDYPEAIDEELTDIVSYTDPQVVTDPVLFVAYFNRAMNTPECRSGHQAWLAAREYTKYSYFYKINTLTVQIECRWVTVKPNQKDAPDVECKTP